MTKLQVLKSELQDKMEYFQWLVQDIEATLNQIETLEKEGELHV
jgi:hypothetical protein